MEVYYITLSTLYVFEIFTLGVKERKRGKKKKKGRKKGEAKKGEGGRGMEGEKEWEGGREKMQVISGR